MWNIRYGNKIYNILSEMKNSFNIKIDMHVASKTVFFDIVNCPPDSILRTEVWGYGTLSIAKSDKIFLEELFKDYLVN